MFGNEYVTLRESTSLVSKGTTGLRTWPAALYFAEFLLTEEMRNVVNDKQILELGSGIGFLGIFLQKINSKINFTFTDCNEEVLDNIKENFKLNFSETPCRANKLDWEALDKCDNLTTDIVLATDVVYDLRIIKPLINILNILLKFNENCQIFIASTIRNEDTSELFKKTLDESELLFQLLSPANCDEIFLYDRTAKFEILKIYKK
ncbi:DgyrCDS11504 [Dimorphilus gyrociliatus]|uniref:DgyrCDS11504 n=1 Tax=Dimorphilus gyrociliatus TaxID=2664684 RepID=A0A7I8W4K4_9ANNE|nr:DgyrCDS11504 [Dimorphilus gyrociliatus]